MQKLTKANNQQHKQKSSETTAGESSTVITASPLNSEEIHAVPALYLRTTQRCGLGVFALRRFAAGTIIERAPVILVPDPQWKLLNRTALQHYYYLWDDETCAIVGGFGSFYNHSDVPNAEFICRPDDRVMEYVALRQITIGEEIFIQYRCPLWFKVI